MRDAAGLECMMELHAEGRTKNLALLPAIEQRHWHSKKRLTAGTHLRWRVQSWCQARLHYYSQLIGHREAGPGDIQEA